MRLPQCTAISTGSKKRIQEHLDRGWREVGIRQTFSGKFAPVVSEELEPRARKHYADIDFGFTGRLWRDPHIPRDFAKAETRKFILECPDDRFFAHRDGFAIVTRTGHLMTVDLVASLDHQAFRILSHAARKLGTRFAQAGTYEDNERAIRLYKRMGLRLVKKELVLHK